MMERKGFFFESISAAILNKAAFGDAYPADYDSLRDAWFAYYHGDRQTMLDDAARLNVWNNVGCPY